MRQEKPEQSISQSGAASRLERGCEGLACGEERAGSLKVKVKVRTRRRDLEAMFDKMIPSRAVIGLL